VAGYYYDDSTNTACYWKNGVRTGLAAPGNRSYASSIAVSGSDVYVAGYYYDISTGTFTACHWRNGVRTDLPIPATADGGAIAIVVVE
jgi:hypothetical protein